MCTYENRGIVNDDYRIKLKEDIENSHNKLKEAVNNFNSVKSLKPINREDLDSFPTMVWKEINDKIKVQKRRNRFGNYLNFYTKMKEGARFSEHFHDDIIESVEVISGEFIDTSVSDTRVYKKGDVVNYEKGVSHTPVAIKDCLLHVLFKP